MRPHFIFGVVALASIGVGCSNRSVPCVGATCSAGYECLANRCTVAGGAPVPRDSERVVLAPIEIGFGNREAASTITLGDARQARLYLRFGAGYKAAPVSAAFLLLSVPAGDPPSRDDVPLEVWSVATGWSPDSVARGAVPAVSRPSASGIARTSPPSVVRVDVTSIVRELARAPGDDGMVVFASDAHDQGVTLITANAGLPALDVYLSDGRAPAAW